MKNGKIDAARVGDEDSDAAMFIIVVVCFYSLSIVFMFILNIKFKIILKSKSGYCCYETNNDLYESQRDETKNTIHMIFSDSSKLLTSVVIPPYIINAAFNERVGLNTDSKTNDDPKDIKPNIQPNTNEQSYKEIQAPKSSSYKKFEIV